MIREGTYYSLFCRETVNVVYAHRLARFVLTRVHTLLAPAAVCASPSLWTVSRPGRQAVRFVRSLGYIGSAERQY